MKHQMFLLPVEPSNEDRALLSKGIRPANCLDVASYSRAKEWAQTVRWWSEEYRSTAAGPWIWTNYHNETGGSAIVGLEGEMINVEAWERRHDKK